MASIGHIAVGMAFGRAFSRDRTISRRAMIAFSVVSMWPDLDVIGFSFGVHYGDPWGHRGATHSILLALVAGALSFAVAKRFGLPVARTVIFTAVVALSHGLLDTMTYGGGLGCALLWPFSTHRFWAPLRFIPIAPIGLGVLSPVGIHVMMAELLIFLPFWAYALMPRREAKT